MTEAKVTKRNQAVVNRQKMSHGAVPSPREDYDDGADKFKISRNLQMWAHNQGYALGWKRFEIDGREDRKNLAEISRQGWTPLTGKDIGDELAQGYSNAFTAHLTGTAVVNNDLICVGDSLLAKIPKEMFDRLCKAPVDHARRMASDDLKRIRAVGQALGDSLPQGQVEVDTSLTSD